MRYMLKWEESAALLFRRFWGSRRAVVLRRAGALATLALLCVYAPGVLSPWIGRFADSYGRRPLLICTDLAIVPALAVLVGTKAVLICRRT